jgi:hypothetical protein
LENAVYDAFASDSSKIFGRNRIVIYSIATGVVVLVAFFGNSKKYKILRLSSESLKNVSVGILCICCENGKIKVIRELLKFLAQK